MIPYLQALTEWAGGGEGEIVTAKQPHFLLHGVSAKEAD